MRTSVLVFTLLVTTLFALPARAQVVAQSSGVTWGVQGAAGIGYGTVPEGSVREMKPTYNAGVFAVTPLAGPFKFQPEVKFDHRDINIGGISTKVNYLSVPLLARSEFLGVFMTQGIALDWVMSAKVFDVDFKDAMTSPDVAVVLGVGKQVGKVSVEARWDTGFRSFQKGINSTGVHVRALTGLVSVYFK